MSYEEIGSHLEMAPDAVQTNLAEAMAVLASNAGAAPASSQIDGAASCHDAAVADCRPPPLMRQGSKNVGGRIDRQRS